MSAILQEVQALALDLELEPVAAHPTPALQQMGNVVALPSAGALTGPMAQALAFLQGGGTLDMLERMMDLQDRFNRDQSHRAYIAAMTQFKKVAPVILKNKHVEFKTDKGITAYDHATLGHIVETVVGVLADYGFTHDWDSVREGDRVKVTCILTHVEGHSKRVTMEGPLDASGGKNNIQAMVSTNSYLERHTFLAVTGLATKDQDDDGRGGAPDSQPPAETGAPAQAVTYAQADFETNSPTWRGLVEKGRKTPAQIITMVQTKAPLSADQITTINSWKKA